jgi:stage II sporulation protein M
MSYKFWVIIATSLFAIGLGIGLIVAMTMPDSVTGFLSEEMSTLEELGDMFGPFQATTAIFIFFKNVSVLLLSFLFSPFFCLLPVLALVLNGVLLSFVSVIVSREESLGLVVAGLLPHGVFEIPAIMIGEAAALSFGATAIMALLSPKNTPLLPTFKQNLKHLALALVLLVPAAIMETYVTPLFLP